MDWGAVSAMAGVVAAIFVALTVVYLTIQIKRSTQATHSQTYHLATSALAEMAAIIGSDKELARIFRIGMGNPESLTEDEFTQFGYLGISLFRRFENVFFQYQSGMIDEDFWVGHRDNILWFFHRLVCRSGGRIASSLSASAFGSFWTVPPKARSYPQKVAACERG